MKKIYAAIMIIILVLAVGFGLAGCNRQVVDLTYSYEKCIIALPNGEVIEGAVDSWKDYEDGDQIQVKIGGTTYLVHSSNIALISD